MPGSPDAPALKYDFLHDGGNQTDRIFKPLRLKFWLRAPNGDMLSNKDPEKARHYLDLLDAARCNGRWQEVPELVRKIGKHAPQRQCLCQTAQTERQIATQAPQRSSALTSLSSTNLAQAAPPLQAVLEKENTFQEDRFQAQVCLAWLHSVLDAQKQVLSRLSTNDVLQAIKRSTDIASSTARWTHICIVKGAYLRALALESYGNTTEAMQVYNSVLPYLAKTQPTAGHILEANVWTERLLARHASLTSRHVKSNINNPHNLLKSKTIQATSVLGPFRVWSDYRAECKDGSFFSLTWVWRAYYDILSILLQHHIVVPIFESRAQQRIELQKSQAAYEAILLKETHFPQANQNNVEIDSWVDQVMSNWRAMLGPSWQDVDLGQGGNAALGKTVLDILYRSATRSFHSTRVLRHLFTVHAQLSEFNLAFKALDTYLEIVAKGKARVEKSGESEASLDDDGTVLCTAASGTKLLCEYGKRSEVERALQIADLLQTWLNKVDSESTLKAGVNVKDNPQDLVKKHGKPKSQVPGSAIAFGYHAIGVCQGRWARLTYEIASRSDLLAKAIWNFRTALKPEFGCQNNLEILYSLAFTFAETRDVDSAVTTVKEAITVGSEDDAQTDGHTGDDALKPVQRRILLKCWHLLALLLSARQKFATAMASCEAAFDPFGGKAVLYGDLTGLNTITGLGMSERKALVELKMTQLALSEVIDGPEDAVNSSGELLGLYAKLFKYSEKDAFVAPEPIREIHTSTTSSPQRSIRGSILGYSKDRRSKLAIGGTANNFVGSFEPSSQTAGAPAIAVTSDNTILPQNPNHHHHFLGRHESNKLKKRHSYRSLQGNSQRKSRAGSPLRPSTADDGGHMLPARKYASTEGHPDTLSPFSAQNYGVGEVGVAISHDMPSSPPTPATEQSNPVHNISSTTQNMDRKNPNAFPVAPKPSSATPPQTITVFPCPSLPEPRYSPLLQTRHALSILAQIWCQISALYRRASLASDAQGAIREATTHVQAIELDIATHEGSSMDSFSSPGYGNLKSLGELWADVLSETGALHVGLDERAKASNAYETALSWCPNHAGAILGLSAILLDSYEAASATSNGNTDVQPAASVSGARSTLPAQGAPTLAPLPKLSTPFAGGPDTNAYDGPKLRPDLTALSARDRAYKLLSSLTKSGLGWDDSDAWFALAKAYELSGQEEKAKEALWWVVELEEGRGIRSWKAADVS